MKYLKTYEAKRTKGGRYKSPSSKRKEAIDKSNKYKEFIPGSYIAFRYYYSKYNDVVILARIIKIKEVIDIETSRFNYQGETQLEVQILKVINNLLEFEFDSLKITNFNMKFINKHYISTSLQNTEEKFSELVEEAEIEKNMNKYNI